MTTLGKFYDFAIAAAKRHWAWLAGVTGAVATAAVTAFATNLFTPVGVYLSEKISPYYCEYRQHGQTPISDETQFNILVSRLTGDPWLSRRDSIMRTFQNEFHLTPICDLFKQDYSMDSQARTSDLRKRAMEVIKARNADLLLFGEVTDEDTVVIWAVNDHGYCDLRPNPTYVKHGFLQGETTVKEKINLIRASLEEIDSTCLKQSSYDDWRVFAQRMKKMGTFLSHFDSSHPAYLYIASSYLQAMRLLYSNGQGDVWFSKGEQFAKRVINKDQNEDHGTSEALSWVYTQYAVLLQARFDKTKDKTHREAEIGAFDKAISLDQKNAFAYEQRGEAYSNNKEWGRAIEDYNKAMALDPEYGRTYCHCHRGLA